MVLKDSCLYIYHDDESVDQASMVIYLHGYRVRSRNISNIRHTFELTPPIKGSLTLILMADSEIDKRRWIALLEYSIDRWIKVMD